MTTPFAGPAPYLLGLAVIADLTKKVLNKFVTGCSGFGTPLQDLLGDAPGWSGGFIVLLNSVLLYVNY